MSEQLLDRPPATVGPENTRLVNAFTDAVIAGDDTESDRLRRLILFRPESLLATKNALGVDFVRQKGLRTDLADAKYGHGWLDR